MPKFNTTFVKIGYATIEADNKFAALDIAANMKDEDIKWEPGEPTDMREEEE